MVTWLITTKVKNNNNNNNNKGDFGDKSRRTLHAIYTTWFKFSMKRHSPNTSDIIDILWNSLNIIYSIFRVHPKVEHLEKNIEFDLINTHR